MEKRLILAIAISMIILLSWSALVQKGGPGKPGVAVSALPTAAATLATPALPAAALSKEELPASPPLNFASQNLEVAFLESPAAIQEVRFKDYQAYKFSLKEGFWLEVKGMRFKKADLMSNVISFIGHDREKQIIKRFIFNNSNYSIELEIETLNLSNLNLQIHTPLILGILDLRGDQNLARFQDVFVTSGEKTLHLAAQKEAALTGVKIFGLRDKYFCLIVQPEEECAGFIKKQDKQISQVGIIPKEIILAPGETARQKFRIYLGPQDLQQINAVNPAWARIVHYGTFDFISQLLLQLLEFFYRLVHNWGVAIIILSLAIFLLLYPITLKQMRSMKEMQVLQPRIEELRKAYKDNPQKLNKEIMGLYREHKVNPIGGCLPLLLQMPVFFALYQVMLRSIALKGAPFLWIKDLSEPDRLFTLPVSLPILGNEFNLLPLLMTLLMFVQQKASFTAHAGGSAAEQQKIMLILMPLMFGFIFYRMPAGLVLYWFMNSLLMLIYQLRMNRAK